VRLWPSSAACSSSASYETAMTDRRIAVVEIVGATIVFLVGSLLHFLYELSGFATWAAVIGSVNESTWEHLKMFFWPGLLVGLIQHAYLRQHLPNLWTAKAVSLWVTPTTIALAFYTYLGVVLPIDGRGTLIGTIITAFIGVYLGGWLSYVVLTAGPVRRRTTRLALASIALLTVMMVAFTWVPPRTFLFEDFGGYTYNGQFGILDDYSDRLVFRPAE
jgi:hypothetical protein